MTFRCDTKYGQGLDWPIGLDVLNPYYRKAEAEIGVSGDAAAQRKVGVEFEEGYALPDGANATELPRPSGRQWHCWNESERLRRGDSAFSHHFSPGSKRHSQLGLPALE